MRADALIKTPEVAKACGRSVNTVIKYAKEIGIYDGLNRARRGDYFFTEEQAERIKIHSMNFQKK